MHYRRKKVSFLLLIMISWSIEFRSVRMKISPMNYSMKSSIISMVGIFIKHLPISIIISNNFFFFHYFDWTSNSIIDKQIVTLKLTGSKWSIFIVNKSFQWIYRSYHRRWIFSLSIVYNHWLFIILNSMSLFLFFSNYLLFHVFLHWSSLWLVI